LRAIRTYQFRVTVGLPVKQGLKLGRTSETEFKALVTVGLPVKQGLKHTKHFVFIVA